MMLYFIKVHQSVITHARPRAASCLWSGNIAGRACTAGDGLWAHLSMSVSSMNDKGDKKKQGSLATWALELAPHPMGRGRFVAPPTRCGSGEFFGQLCGIGNAVFGSKGWLGWAG